VFPIAPSAAGNIGGSSPAASIAAVATTAIRPDDGTAVDRFCGGLTSLPKALGTRVAMRGDGAVVEASVAFARGINVGRQAGREAPLHTITRCEYNERRPGSRWRQRGRSRGGTTNEASVSSAGVDAAGRPVSTLQLGPVAVTHSGSSLEDRWFTKGASWRSPCARTMAMARASVSMA
jgi:hypothetical protein